MDYASFVRSSSTLLSQLLDAIFDSTIFKNLPTANMFNKAKKAVTGKADNRKYSKQNKHKNRGTQVKKLHVCF